MGAKPKDRRLTEASHNGIAKREGTGDQLALMAFGGTRMQDFPMQQGDAAQVSWAELFWRAPAHQGPQEGKGLQLAKWGTPPVAERDRSGLQE